MHSGLKIFVLFFFFIIQTTFAFTQVEKSNLIPLLSAADQKKIEKIETTLDKGENVIKEAESIKNSAPDEKEIYKNEKKYSLKRLEAAQHFQKANNDIINLFKDNISAFWKKNKSDQIKPIIKNYEDKASELSRKARSLRYVAEDLIYPEEKLEKIIEAEEVEKEAIAIYIKVLYAYLNQPVEYNVIVSSDKNEIAIKPSSSSDSVLPKSEKQNENTTIEYIPAISREDSAQNTIMPEDNLQEPITTKENSLKQKDEIPESDNQKDSTSIYNLVNVKEDQIDKFNNYLKDSFPENYEHYVIDFKALKYNDIESLKESWRRYLYTPQYAYEPEPTKTAPALQDTSGILADNSPAKNIVVTKRPQKDERKESQTKENQNSSAKNTSSQTKFAIKNTQNPETNSTTVKTTTKKRDSNVLSQTKKVSNNSQVFSETTPSFSSATKIAEGFVYRVQILACRIPLDSESLKHIYNGELDIIELNEDKWFKYALGEFNTYKDASLLKNQINVPGAFIIAYLNGKRIKILNTDSYSHSNSDSPTGLVTYKVQISASKLPLDEKYLQNIYSGNHKIEEAIEDNWYKYSIVFGSSLSKALNFIQKENIPGAFITSYKNDKKIELREALKISQSN